MANKGVNTVVDDEIYKAFFYELLTNALVSRKHKGVDCIVLHHWNDKLRLVTKTGIDLRNPLEEVYVPPHKFVEKVVSIRSTRRNNDEEAGKEDWSVGIHGAYGYNGGWINVCKDTWLYYLRACMNDVCVSYLSDMKKATVRKRKRKSPPKKPTSPTNNVITFPKKKGKRRR